MLLSVYRVVGILRRTVAPSGGAIADTPPLPLSSLCFLFLLAPFSNHICNFGKVFVNSTTSHFFHASSHVVKAVISLPQLHVPLAEIQRRCYHLFHMTSQASQLFLQIVRFFTSLLLLLLLSLLYLNYQYYHYHYYNYYCHYRYYYCHYCRYITIIVITLSL